MRLKVYLPGQSSSELFDLFCYSSHGIPGLELVGFGPRARSMKEKIIYLTKSFKIKMPLKRFVICLDRATFKREGDEYFELPILILYWTMGGSLPVKTLKDCLCSGKINSRAQVLLPSLKLLNDQMDMEEITLIGLEGQLGHLSQRFISVEQLIPSLRYSVDR